MRHIKNTLIGALILLFLSTSLVFAGYQYKPKKDHLGGDIAPVEALKMMKKNPKNTFIVDVRTRYEYQVIGHVEGAYNIPIKFFTTTVGKKGYTKSKNPNFGQDILARFSPETDTLILYCRSAKRSCDATNDMFGCVSSRAV
ncbi:rhodanese-like domain-containing protein [Desulfococcaceae bacterium HSG7]|nr:rhodanese-like domain-containing protein [Desulfococcaceae bacterium HSG7]